MTNPNKQKAKCFAREFYRAALRPVGTLHVLYFSIIDANPGKIGPDHFGNFLAVEVQHTKTTMTNVLNIFPKAMKLFQDNVGEKICGVAKNQQTEER